MAQSKESSPISEAKLVSDFSRLQASESEPGFEAEAATDAQDSESSTKWSGDKLPSANGQKEYNISPSEKYPIPDKPKWKNANGMIDLKTIMERKELPIFIREVGQKSTAYNELREACQRSMSPPKDGYNPKKCEAPYWSYCRDGLLKELPTSGRKGVPHQEESSVSAPKMGPEAYSLTPIGNVKRDNDIIKIDCEYILDMYIPAKMNRSFITDPSTSFNDSHKQIKRWIFIPSFLRAECGLFNWEESKVDLQKTNRIIVVIPSQFDTYISKCGHALPILCLPQDVLGIGYARHWILKIAMRLGLEYVWMIDDSVSWFCRYSCPGKQMKDSNPHLNFEQVLEEMEDIAQSDNCKGHLAAIGPSRWRGACNTSKRFTYKPPQIAVYLNLKLIKEHQIQYRPQLEKMEDMVFGAECMIQGLTVCRWNEMRVFDMMWDKTGVASPYFPRDKATTLSDSQPSTPKSRGVQRKPSKLY